jgi:hypothetical protein
MTIKQKIDKYLKDNYGDVLFETKVKGFRWQKIADKIGKDINKDFVKDRWKVVKKKMEDGNLTLVSKIIEDNKKKEVKIPEVSFEIVTGNSCTPLTKEELENYKITFTPTLEKPKEKFNLITFFKNLFKKL